MNPEYLSSYFVAVTRTVKKIPINIVDQAADLIKHSKRIWLAGNGGSAATAIHFANDLQKMCNLDVMCIPSMISTITGYGNDNGWVNMYADSMNSFKPEDTLIAISYSGVSENVIRAAGNALTLNGHIICLTGPRCERNILSRMPGIIIAIEEEDIKVVEDIHLSICHAIAGVIHAMRGVQDSLSNL